MSKFRGTVKRNFMISHHLSLHRQSASHLRSEHAIFSCASNPTPKLIPNSSYRFHVRKLSSQGKSRGLCKIKGIKKVHKSKRHDVLTLHFIS